MTETTALRMAEQLKDELKRPGYSVDFRDIIIDPTIKRVVEATDHTYIILCAEADLVIQSELGTYDSWTNAIAERQHVHTGRIEIVNYSPSTHRNVQFLQLIWH